MNRTDAALLVLRVPFGASLAWHGLNKVRGGIAGTAGWFASIGFRWPRLQAVLAAGTEIIAGLLLVLGLVTGPASAAMIALMVVAIATVHWKVGYFIFLPNGGWEYCGSIIVVGAVISLMGPGRGSVDEVLGAPWANGAWWILVGVGGAVLHLALTWRPSPAPTGE